MTDPLTIIRSVAPKYGLDPAAVVAYALTQGGTSWGAVGDKGTSFGPFQAHIGGAAGRRSPQEASTWANSPQGLSEMMGMMSRAGASGMSGPDAAAYIVGPSFGRGANPARDMSNARAAYPRAQQLLGSTPAAAPAPSIPRGNAATPAAPQQVAPQINRAALVSLLQRQFMSTGKNAPDLQPVLDLVAASSPAPSAAAPPPDASSSSPRGGAVGTALPSVRSVADKFGLHVTSAYRSVAQQARLYANRSTSGSVAAPGKSYHNSGRAIDVSPNAASLKFLAYARVHPEQFTEVFYDPAGWYIKNGRIVRGAIGGHGDHVHIAI